MIKPRKNNVLLIGKPRESKVIIQSKEYDALDIFVEALGPDCSKDLKVGQKVHAERPKLVEQKKGVSYYMCSDDDIIATEE